MRTLAFALQSAALIAEGVASASSVDQAAAIVACVGGGLALISYFATRREVDKLDDRLTDIERLSEKRTLDLHRRINRVASCVDRIAGKLGVHVTPPDVYEDE